MTLQTAKGLKGHGHQHEAWHMCENAANLYDEKGVHTIQPTTAGSRYGGTMC